MNILLRGRHPLSVLSIRHYILERETLSLDTQSFWDDSNFNLFSFFPYPNIQMKFCVELGGIIFTASILIPGYFIDKIFFFLLAFWFFLFSYFIFDYHLVIFSYFWFCLIFLVFRRWFRRFCWHWRRFIGEHFFFSFFSLFIWLNLIKFNNL